MQCGITIVAEIDRRCRFRHRPKLHGKQNKKKMDVEALRRHVDKVNKQSYMNAEKWHKNDAAVIELSFIALIKDLG